MLMKNDVTEWFPWWVDLFFPSSLGKKEKEKGENIILREDKAECERMQSAWSSQQNHLWLRYGNADAPTRRSLFGPQYLLWYTIDQNILV